MVSNNENYYKSSANHLSCWFVDITEPLQFDKLDNNLSCDIVIVGGGIAGLSTAYNLSKSGKNVIVIEDGYIGSGETGHTTAHITQALDERYFNLQKVFGIGGSSLAAESHAAAIDFIESVINKEGIKCDFERIDGYLFLGPKDTKQTLYEELEATHRIGIKTELITKAPLPSFDTGLCLKFPNQAQFHPLKYIKGLANAITKNNGKIFTQTHVQDVTDKGIITSNKVEIRASKIVIATNAPIIDKVSKIYDKQIPNRTYSIGALIKKGTVPKGLYWDTGNNVYSINKTNAYHYIRIQEISDSLYNQNKSKTSNLASDKSIDHPENTNIKNNKMEYELLIVGGEDHKTGDKGNTEERYMQLIEWAKNHFPIQDVLFKWSGQVMEPLDYLAFIGLNPVNKDNNNNKNIYIATGDSGNGITHGTIAGILISDLILGKENKWTELYNPSRKISEPNGNDDKNKKIYFDNNDKNTMKDQKVNDPLKHTSNNNNIENKKNINSIINSLLPEEGKIINENPDDPIAIYRNNKGKINMFSAKCTHLGCTLVWNSVETSFDCPCHGSRFFNNGKVINGPANEDLKKMQ